MRKIFKILILSFVVCIMASIGACKSSDITVSLDKSSISILVNEEATLTATITGSKDKVTWASSNNSIATVDDTGKVKAIAEGECNITAKCKKVVATCAVTVNLPTYAPILVIEHQVLSMFVGNSNSVNAYVTYDGETVDAEISYQIEDASVATVTSEGNVTAIKKGETNITVTMSYKGMTDSKTVTLKVVPNMNLLLDADSATLIPKAKVGIEGELSLKVNVESIKVDDENVENPVFVWTSEDESVATVSSVGLIKAEAPGETRIICTYTKDDNESVSAYVNVVVNKGEQILTDKAFLDYTWNYGAPDTVSDEFIPVTCPKSLGLQPSTLLSITDVDDNVIGKIDGGVWLNKNLFDNNSYKSIVLSDRNFKITIPLEANYSKKELTLAALASLADRGAYMTSSIEENVGGRVAKCFESSSTYEDYWYNRADIFDSNMPDVSKYKYALMDIYVPDETSRIALYYGLKSELFAIGDEGKNGFNFIDPDTKEFTTLQAGKWITALITFGNDVEEVRIGMSTVKTKTEKIYVSNISYINKKIYNLMMGNSQYVPFEFDDSYCITLVNEAQIYGNENEKITEYQCVLPDDFENTFEDIKGITTFSGSKIEYQISNNKLMLNKTNLEYGLQDIIIKINDDFSYIVKCNLKNVEFSQNAEIFDADSVNMSEEIISSYQDKTNVKKFTTTGSNSSSYLNRANILTDNLPNLDNYRYVVISIWIEDESNLTLFVNSNIINILYGNGTFGKIGIYDENGNNTTLQKERWINIVCDLDGEISINRLSCGISVSKGQQKNLYIGDVRYLADVIFNNDFESWSESANSILNNVVITSYLLDIHEENSTNETYENSHDENVQTETNIYKGEYTGTLTSGQIKGNAIIVFGKVSDDATNYGIIIFKYSSEAEANSPENSVATYTRRFSATGKQNGKFGVALYNLPDGFYVACAYNEDEKGDYVKFISGKVATYKLNSYAKNISGNLVLFKSELKDGFVGKTVSIPTNSNISGYLLDTSLSSTSKVVTEDGLTVLNVVYVVSDLEVLDLSAKDVFNISGTKVTKTSDRLANIVGGYTDNVQGFQSINDGWGPTDKTYIDISSYKTTYNYLVMKLQYENLRTYGLSLFMDDNLTVYNSSDANNAYLKIYNPDGMVINNLPQSGGDYVWYTLVFDLTKCADITTIGFASYYPTSALYFYIDEVKCVNNLYSCLSFEKTATSGALSENRDTNLSVIYWETTGYFSEDAGYFDVSKAQALGIKYVKIEYSIMAKNGGCTAGYTFVKGNDEKIERFRHIYWWDTSDKSIILFNADGTPYTVSAASNSAAGVHNIAYIDIAKLADEGYTKVGIVGEAGGIKNTIMVYEAKYTNNI